MSQTVKRLIIAFIILFTICLLIGVAIYFYNTLAKTEPNDNNLHLSEIHTANNLEEMVEASEYIVIGSYEGLHSTINLARDENDISKESADQYMGGKVYRFKIDEILKGENLSDTVKVIHRYSNKFEVGETLGFKDEEVEDVDPTFIKPRFNKPYILFLDQSELGDNMFIKSIEPFLISAADPEYVEVDSSIIEELNFKDNITGKNLDKIKKNILSLK